VQRVFSFACQGGNESNFWTRSTLPLSPCFIDWNTLRNFFLYTLLRSNVKALKKILNWQSHDVLAPVTSACSRAALGAAVVTTFYNINWSDSMHKMLMAAVVAAGLAQGCSTISDSQKAASPEASYVWGDKKIVSAGSIAGGSEGCLRSVGWNSDNIMVECEASAKPVAAAPSTKPAAKKVARLSYDGQALFEFDSSELTTLGRRELNSLVSKLKRHGGIGSIDVVGHADSIGDSSYNQSLSESRASTVRRYLESTLNDVKIQASGMGEAAPVADNSTPTGRQRNRRVEVKVDAMVAE